MKRDIDELIIELQEAITEKYGANFKKFYLVNYDDEWKGLFSCYDNEGKRIPIYYKIKEDRVITEEKYSVHK
jgi:hypothetical protein